MPGTAAAAHKRAASAPQQGSRAMQNRLSAYQRAMRAKAVRLRGCPRRQKPAWRVAGAERRIAFRQLSVSRNRVKRCEEPYRRGAARDNKKPACGLPAGAERRIAFRQIKCFAPSLSNAAGNFAECGSQLRFSFPIDEPIQILAPKFPMHPNRQFFEKVCRRGNRDAGQGDPRGKHQARARAIGTAPILHVAGSANPASAMTGSGSLANISPVVGTVEDCAAAHRRAFQLPVKRRCVISRSISSVKRPPDRARKRAMSRSACF